MLGYFSPDVDFQNFDAYDLLQEIVDKFSKFKSNLNEEITKMQMRSTINEKSTFKAVESTDTELKV